MLFIVANIVSYIKKPEVINETLPNVQITLLKGETKPLSAYRGKPLIIYFWGSWCPICKMSSPVIDALSKDYDVVTVAVNSGSDEDIRRFMKKRGLDFPVVNDEEGDLAGKFGVDTFPTTFIYNDKGSISFTDIGFTSPWSLRLKLWLSKYF
jgi:thiol-disulfide isomerase/thioredoxin